MGITEEVIEKLRALPEEKQRLVLEYVESLGGPPKPPSEAPVRLKGLWAGLGIDVSEEDITEARREMWVNFPRELPE